MLRRVVQQWTRTLPAALGETNALLSTPLWTSQRSFSDEAVKSGVEWDPSQICELARIADRVAFAQETSQHWPLIAGVQHSLEYLHEATGCPWWLTISLVTVGFRFLIFPVTLIQIRNSVRLSNAMPETEAAKEAFEKSIAQGMDTQKAKTQYTTDVARIWKKHDCNPVKSMLPLFANGFVFVSFFIALRGLAEIKVPSMCYEGAFWFNDLTMADPYYALPVINSLIFWITIELGAADGMQGTDPAMIQRMKNIMRILAVVFIPITASFPSSLFCYWITSSCFSLIQSTAIKNDKIRAVLKLPPSVKRPSTDPLKNPLFGRPVRQINADGEEIPIKAKISPEEARQLWKDRMATLLQRQGAKDEAPVVYTSQPRKHKTSKIRRTKR